MSTFLGVVALFACVFVGFWLLSIIAPDTVKRMAGDDDTPPWP